MKVAITLAAGVAGVLCAALLTFPAIALAWDWTQLPNGYAVQDLVVDNPDGSSCHHVSINGTYIGDNCDAANFQQALDAYVNSTICTVNPTAGQAQGMCLPTTTTTAAAPTTTDASTTTAVVTSDVTTEPTPPAPSPTVTVTTSVTTTVTDTTLEQRVSALEQRQAVDEARIATLEAATGAILGEPKNESPFTDPV